MVVAPIPPSPLPEPEAALLDELLAKYRAAQPHSDAWRQERAQADAAWRARRAEIRADVKVSPGPAAEVRRIEGLLQKKTSDARQELRAAASERDAIITRARSEYAKKESQLKRDLKTQRQLLANARESVPTAERDCERRVRQQYAAERARFFEEERRLNAIDSAADKAWRDPVNSDAMPKSVRVAFWDAVRAEAK